MPDLNKVFLMGRLTFDPELRKNSQRHGGDRAAHGHEPVVDRTRWRAAGRRRYSST